MACTASITLRRAENSGASDETWKLRPRPSCARCGIAQAVDPLAEETDGAGIGTQRAGDLVDEGGLAGSIGSDQRVDFAREEVEIDIFRSPGSAPKLLHRSRIFQDRLSHDVPSPPATH